MGKFRLSKTICMIFVFCAAMAIASPAQTFTTLHSFNGTDGTGPQAGLVQATDGNFYGTTGSGGANDFGTVFKITSPPGSVLTTLYSFCSQLNCTDGAGPQAGLIQGTDGNFYGTTVGGGAKGCKVLEGPSGCGTVFKITPEGTLTTLYSFCAQPNCTDGANPEAGLVLASDGNFYGTTLGGGSSSIACFPSSPGCGTAFRISPAGTLTTLYSFCGQPNCTDGDGPVAGLVQAIDRNFYGTTKYNGASSGNCPSGCGTVFRITPEGTLTTLHSFGGTDGAIPDAGLVQATDGNFYGTTAKGGANNNCTDGCGTVFNINPQPPYTLTTLHSFCAQTSCTDGVQPEAGLVQGTDGNFYGTTLVGGANPACFGGSGCGTVFEITPGGTLNTLHNFDGTDGSQPDAGLIQGTDGNFYGTAELGGTNSACGSVGCGTVFSLSVGLAPFVETQPTSGNVGAHVIILGTNLTGATNVSFNGARAVFRVLSSSEILTTVPRNASTGKIQVKTPDGTLTSNVNFRVKHPWPGGRE